MLDIAQARQSTCYSLLGLYAEKGASSVAEMATEFEPLTQTKFHGDYHGIQMLYFKPMITHCERVIFYKHLFLTSIAATFLADKLTFLAERMGSCHIEKGGIEFPVCNGVNFLK